MDYVWAVQEYTHDGIKYQELFASKSDAKAHMRKKHRETGFEYLDLVKILINKGDSK